MISKTIHNFLSKFGIATGGYKGCLKYGCKRYCGYSPSESIKFNQSVERMSSMYDKPRKYFNRSHCLVCGHQEKVYHPSKEEYQEVTVCPKCNGAFVDMFKLSKYKQSIATHKTCEHKYQALDSSTTTFYSDDKQCALDVTGTFYCEKCLDIKHMNRTVNTMSNE